VTANELAILRSVVYASLFEYPLTLDELHVSLIESNAGAEEILATYWASPALQRAIAYADGFFYPVGRDNLLAERRLREARSRAFLRRYRRVLRFIAAVPFTRLVALSGSIAHLNLERGGDIDLFIVVRGRHAWMVTLMVLLLTKALRSRRVVCVNFVLSDDCLELEAQDLFTANQVIHLRPLIGAQVLDDLIAKNPFVTHIYPNARAAASQELEGFSSNRGVPLVKRILERALASPMFEAVCRRFYGRHLRRRAGMWRTPDQVRLGDGVLKLHARSHRPAVLERFEAAVTDAWRVAHRVPKRAAAG
jgi:hypothetical protein